MFIITVAQLPAGPTSVTHERYCNVHMVTELERYSGHHYTCPCALPPMAHLNQYYTALNTLLHTDYPV